MVADDLKNIIVRVNFRSFSCNAQASKRNNKPVLTTGHTNMIGAHELIENLRTDCVYYLGDRPCRPHVEAGHRCTCTYFQPTVRRGVIIKLGAAGDVLRSTPLLRTLDPIKTGTKVLCYPLSRPSTHSHLRSRSPYCGNSGADRSGHMGLLLESGQRRGSVCDRRLDESDRISRIHTSGRRTIPGR